MEIAAEFSPCPGLLPAKPPMAWKRFNSLKHQRLDIMIANAFEDDVRQSLPADMNGHISKPLSIDEVI